MRVFRFSLACAVLLFTLALTGSDRGVWALPPAGSDLLPVVATVDVTSRLGSETVALTGWAQVDREAPHTEGSVEVVDLEIVSMDLIGASSIGAVSAASPTNIGPLGAISQAADTGGDGNGFQTTPTGAFLDDFLFATDTDSGTTTSTSCADPGKDRHRYWGFGGTLPPSATIEGIEVRVDARADSTVGSPFMCVELSWDGGNTWTAAKTTGTLPAFPAVATFLLGGASDTWGRTWSSTDLTGGNFRVRVTNVASDNLRDFSLDFVAVTVRFQASSPGEIRSLQAGQDFPASSFVDLYTAVTVPATPGGTAVSHNVTPLHLIPRQGAVDVDLDAWPPLGVTYGLDPIFGVDNDGDTLIDEDTADDDRDGLVEEDRTGTDPDTPGSGSECQPDADCDGREGEDPPFELCTLARCDEDGDGQMDEDPSCVPLMNPGNVNNMKAGFCIRDVTLEFAPELPSYSVGRGGPSALHPADILALTPAAAAGGSGPLALITCNDDFSGVQSQVTFSATAGVPYRIQVGSYDGLAAGSLTLNVYSTPGSPSPVAVSGNDNFASARIISSLPFQGQQSTVGFTMEAGEPTLATDACTFGAEGISKTAWYSFTPSQNQTITIDTLGSNFDTVLGVFTGDGFGSGGGGGGQAPFTRIPCASLGLTAGGCDIAGGVDDLDALSYGDDLPAGAAHQVNFSVGPGAQGAPGTAVRVQRDCPSPEPEPDEFSSTFNSTNAHVMDGNGPVGACSSAFPLSLIESAGARDDLDALDEQDPAAVDPDSDGVPELPVYFSLDTSSPSLSTLGFSAADVLKTVNGAPPTVFASAAALGLTSGDDLDALCLDEDGSGTYGANDTIFFSLAPGSSTLTAIGAGPGDILKPGPLTVAEDAALLGLQAADDVDALKCQGPAKDENGDTDGDTIPNGTDLDDDGDGCTDVQEQGLTAALGGMRNPHSFWDLMDVPAGVPPVRDQRVNIVDIGGVVARFGAFRSPPPDKDSAFAEAITPPPPAPAYHTAFDRGGPIPNQNLWNLLPPNGSINIADIGATVVQFGHTCVE